MYERSMQLIDDAFSSYQYTEILTSGRIFPIQNGEVRLQGRVLENYHYPLSDGEKAHIEIYTTPIFTNKKEKIIGQFRIYLSKRLLFSGNLYKL